MTAFFLTAWLAASKASHARFSFVDGRVNNGIFGIQEHYRHQNLYSHGDNDGRRYSSNKPRGMGVVGLVEVKREPVHKVKRIYTWTCQYCGVEFETEKYTKRYCKPSHKTRAFELRREQHAGKSVDPE